METVLIRNGLIVDGSGGEPYPGGVLVRGDKIAAVGAAVPGEAEADRVVDAAGKAVCPGFVDIHRHCDARLLRGMDGAAELAQGITTVAMGNCGMSFAPSPQDLGQARELYAFTEPVMGAVDGPGPGSLSSYLEQLEGRELPFNAAALVGIGTLRIGLQGFARELGPAGEEALVRELEEALEAGAAGVSVGLMYLPECYGSPEEYGRILAPAGRQGATLTAHIRGEGDSLEASVAEILEIGRRTGCPLEISHFKCCGRDNWGRGIHRAAALVEEARAKGQDVAVDFYPYDGGSTALTTMIPPALVNGDMAGTLARLGTAAGVEEFRRAVDRRHPGWDNYALSLGWDRILLCGLAREENRVFQGMSVEQAAREAGFPDGASFAAWLMHREEGRTAIINLSMCAEDVEAVAALPYASVISDALYGDTDTPHPRFYGAFPKVIRELVVEKRKLSLGEAVRKMTAQPADRLGLKGRGRLEAGAWADVVVFDPYSFRDHATYGDPARPATGLELSLVNGRIAWEGGRPAERGWGRVLRGG